MKKWKQHQRAIKDHLGNDIGTAEALMEKIRSTFAELDTSGDGFIDYSELKVVSIIYGRSPLSNKFLSPREWKQWA
jgi:hypothetical protein